MDYYQLSRDLLDDWNSCMQMRVPSNVVALQLEIDKCARLAFKLDQEYAWGSDLSALIAAYNELLPNLNQLKEHLIFEVLRSVRPANK